MPVTVVKTAKVKPLRGAIELTFECKWDRVTITAVFGPKNFDSATIWWKDLWTATFFKNQVSKSPDSRVTNVAKRTATAEGPSKIKFSFVPSGNFGEIEVSTKDLRQALLAIK